MGIGIRLGGIRIDIVPPLINAPFAELIDTWHYEYDGNDFKEKIYDLDTLLATPNIDFDPDNTLAPALDMFDRSNTTIWSADARGVGYNAAEPYTWAVDEISDDALISQWVNAGYEGRLFPIVTFSATDVILSFDGMLNYSEQIIGEDRDVVYDFTSDQYLRDVAFGIVLTDTYEPVLIS